jgi:3-oxoacyl-[acyl-carrier-protein] synthase-1
VVCGVDSYINASSLLWLDQHSRLKTAMNSNGVIPGEAAACVLVERTEAEPKQVCVARLVGLGFAQEKAPILSEDPLLGLGLAEAARNALGEAQLPMHEIDYRLSDVTGESYGFKEQALMLSRLLKVRRESLPVWHCADSIGETGAAAGVCQLVIAVHAWRKPYAPGKRAICCTSAVPGHRAVAVLEREVFKDAAREGFPAAGPLDGAWSRGS